VWPSAAAAWSAVAVPGADEAINGESLKKAK
jgi:hypothetical protein